MAANAERTGCAACYRNSLVLALEHGIASIAFPAISTGAYRFPPDRAARIALGTVLAALPDAPSLERVVFCCFGAESREHHAVAFAHLTRGKSTAAKPLLGGGFKRG